MENYMNNTGLDWNDVIEDTAPEYITVPEGEYQFVITAMERGHFPGSEKIKACNKASITFKVLGVEGLCSFKHDILLSKMLQWRIAQFFRCLGMMEKNGKLKMDWDNLVGKEGRARIKVRSYTNRDGEERKVNDIETFLDYDESKMKSDKLNFVELDPDEDLPF